MTDEERSHLHAEAHRAMIRCTALGDAVTALLEADYTLVGTPCFKVIADLRNSAYDDYREAAAASLAATDDLIAECEARREERKQAREALADTGTEGARP
jgi:hypothetical protein